MLRPRPEFRDLTPGFDPPCQRNQRKHPAQQGPVDAGGGNAQVGQLGRRRAPGSSRARAQIPPGDEDGRNLKRGYHALRYRSPAKARRCAHGRRIPHHPRHTGECAPEGPWWRPRPARKANSMSAVRWGAPKPPRGASPCPVRALPEAWLPVRVDHGRLQRAPSGVAVRRALRCSSVCISVSSNPYG